jgi:hypothetical protein
MPCKLLTDDIVVLALAFIIFLVCGIFKVAPLATFRSG